MPNRIVREGILTSARMATLDWASEVFFRRLMSVVDDFGRYYADPGLLRAACYPRQLNKVSDSDIGKWMRCVAEAALVRVYPAEDGERYLEIVNFGQQVRTNKSKFPGPKGEPNGRPLPNESDVESVLEEHIRSTGEFFGLVVTGVRRQVRVGDSYIDLLLDTSAGPCVIELKRGNVTDKHLAQIVRYLALVPESFGVLIGAAIGPRMNKGEAADSGVAICTYTDDMVFSVNVTSDHIISSVFSVNHGKSRAHLDVSVFGDVSVSVSDALPSVVPRARGRPSKRCPEDFEVTAELRAWAAEKAPGVDVDRETEAFRDWEFRDAKSDWPATWRRWMRKAAEDLQTRGGRTNSRPLDAKEAGRAAAAASIYGTGQPLDLSHGTREQEPFTIDV